MLMRAAAGFVTLSRVVFIILLRIDRAEIPQGNARSYLLVPYQYRRATA